MPVAETKAPALNQTLGQAGQSGGPKRRPVFFRRARGLVHGGRGQPWAIGCLGLAQVARPVPCMSRCSSLVCALTVSTQSMMAGGRRRRRESN